MPFATREVRDALTGKLGFTEDPSGHHRKFIRWHNGQPVAVTHISHGAGGREVSDYVLGAMARQLRVTGPTLRGAITCSVGPEGFLQALLDGLERR